MACKVYLTVCYRVTTNATFILTRTEHTHFFPRTELVSLPLTHSTFIPTKNRLLIPHYLKGWPTSLPWYPKMSIHLQSCGTNSISSGRHQALQTCPSVLKELYYLLIFSWWLFILPAPNQTIFLQLEGKTSPYHCLQLRLYTCLEPGEYERIL